MPGTCAVCGGVFRPEVVVLSVCKKILQKVTFFPCNLFYNLRDILKLIATTKGQVPSRTERVSK